MSSHEAIARYVDRLVPGGRLLRARPLRVDVSDDGETTKGVGYGKPVRLEVVDAEGGRHDLVLHTAVASGFGHDHRADRAAEMILAYDTFGTVPEQAEAVDLGVFGPGGELRSLRGHGEFFLVTRWVDGHPYVDDLRAIAERGEAEARDHRRADALARYLGRVHEARSEPGRYVRAIRDLVGHGEGIMGIVDGYPDEHAEVLQRIEEALVPWRWKLKARTDRLVRTHGDFHPFNVILTDDDEVRVLDASRGSQGDAADDVVAMAINYLFFGLQHPSAWSSAYRPLWDRFWRSYAEARPDPGLGEVVAPFFTWRALVLASPVWYPHLSSSARSSLWRLAEGVLRAPRFDPDRVEEFLS